jgi:hypothetical protein
LRGTFTPPAVPPDPTVAVRVAYEVADPMFADPPVATLLDDSTIGIPSCTGSRKFSLLEGIVSSLDAGTVLRYEAFKTLAEDASPGPRGFSALHAASFRVLIATP